jgi:hypothetical protein
MSTGVDVINAGSQFDDTWPARVWSRSTSTNFV